MAETVNIAAMAEKLSNELFKEFLWTKVGPTNQNWPCERTEVHDAASHPTDVVFYYDEPYTMIRTFLQCDLKSYAKGSITQSNIREALESLAKQVSCVEISEVWQSIYSNTHLQSRVHGLLFVYNHDGMYDRDFQTIVDAAKSDGFDVPSGSRLFVLGPDDINWLDNVRFEIRQLRGDEKIPFAAQCKFYFPHLVQKLNLKPDTSLAANIEMLLSPWIVLQHDEFGKSDQKGIILFHRSIPTVDGLMYIIDYLKHNQFLTKTYKVSIKYLSDHGNAGSVFERAASQYIDRFLLPEHSELADIIRSVDCSAIQQARSVFSSIQLGMEDERITS